MLKQRLIEESETFSDASVKISFSKPIVAAIENAKQCPFKEELYNELSRQMKANLSRNELSQEQQFEPSAFVLLYLNYSGFTAKQQTIQKLVAQL